ncbi:polysaccharide pyruvyl transferase family protein [Roseovarius sp. EL26]|uniref:polysaccharide pyruvyl transferase family protein n=1 Tax=Roseovarius sp. EL26 TaxID=2126672 RepID=UPI000EA2EDFC|nr:polysaccharide pyruvyl transferase family protein [Roseovarius sp. EL26]
MKKSADYKFPNRIMRYMQRTGFYNDRNLFWSFYEPRNFGDWIGPYLFEAYTGQTPMHFAPQLGGWAKATFSAGSILRNSLIPNTATIWGSGIISAADTFPRPKNVLAVRGPRSKARLEELNYPTTNTFGDPGILIPQIYNPQVAPKFRVGLIPHYVDYEAMHATYADLSGLRVIDVRRDLESVIDQILSCEMTLSSSLHGIILSHSYGRPCLWIESWKGLIGDGVKFLDYYEGANVFGVTAKTLPRHASLSHLEAMVSDSVMTDLEALRTPLRRACPFGQPNLVAKNEIIRLKGLIPFMFQRT